MSLLPDFYQQFSSCNVSIATFLFIYNNYVWVITFLSPSLKAARLCFDLISLGRPFHRLTWLVGGGPIHKMPSIFSPGERSSNDPRHYLRPIPIKQIRVYPSGIVGSRNDGYQFWTEKYRGDSYEFGVGLCCPTLKPRSLTNIKTLFLVVLPEFPELALSTSKVEKTVQGSNE